MHPGSSYTLRTGVVYVRNRDHMFRLSSIVRDITEGVAESKTESPSSSSVWASMCLALLDVTAHAYLQWALPHSHLTRLGRGTTELYPSVFRCADLSSGQCEHRGLTGHATVAQQQVNECWVDAL